MHTDASPNMEVVDDDRSESSFNDPSTPKKQGRGQPPKYQTADMSVASMAAILTTMAGGGVKPQVVKIMEDVTQLQEVKETTEYSEQLRPYQCELCEKRFKEV